MSLILEALKKLEREKESGDRGLVVLSHLPWVGGQTRRRGLPAASIALLALVMLALGIAGIWRWRGGGDAPTTNAPPSGNTTTAAPAARSAAPVGPATGTVAPESPIGPPPARTDTRTVAARPVLPANRRPLPNAEPTAPSDALVAPAGPIQPGHAPAQAMAREVHLNAISVRDGHPVAILNDRLVREGDSFDGIRVLRIGEAEVEVEVGGVRKILTF